jgi:hypothetical protein
MECKPPRRWWRQCWHGDFLPRFTWLSPSYVPVVSTAHLVVRWLIGITCQGRTLGTVRTYPESEGSSMTRSTRVTLRDPLGVSTIPLTNPPSKHRTIFLRASTESQAIKPSRRWQPPRVISTIGLQLDHLVPLNATSRCNALESYSLAIDSHSCKHKWVRGHPSTPTQATKAQGCPATNPRPTKCLYTLI